MPTFHFTSPEGKSYEIEGPEGATPEQAFGILQQHLGASASPDASRATPAPTAPSEAKAEKKRAGAAGVLSAPEIAGPVGAGEVALSGATGLAATVAGGVAGAGRTAAALLGGDSFDKATDKGADTSKAIQKAATYEPRTPVGKQLGHAASLPGQLAEDLAGKGLGAAGRAVGGEEGGRRGEAIGRAGAEAAMDILGVKGMTRPFKAPEAVAGKDFSPLRDLTPEQGERLASQTKDGVKPTLGSVTRDPAQVRFEQQEALRSDGPGASLAQRSIENDGALKASVEKLKQGPGVRGATDLNEADTGRAVRSAAENKQAVRKQEVDDLYNQARASGETKAQVDLDPLHRWIKEHEADAIAHPQLKGVFAAIDETTKLNEPKGGWKRKQQKTASIDEIENLRKRAGIMLQSADGSLKSYLTTLRQGIDTMTDGAGGDLYKAARKSRRELGDEFEEQGANANLIDKKSRSDYKVAAEDVWRKTVVTGSTEDLRNVIDMLKTDKARAGTGDAGPVKPQGTQALQELQAQTISHLTEESTKSLDGSFSPAAMRTAIRKIGQEKLTLLLGPEAMDSLLRTERNAIDVKINPRRAPGSDTQANRGVRDDRIQSRIAEQAASHAAKMLLPKIVGRGIDLVREGAAKRAERRAVSESVDEALTPNRAPLADIRAQATATGQRRRTYLMGETGRRGAMTIPLAEQDQNR